ncbi:MAG: cell envelope integrity protein TolA [Legionellales bacterium]|nr:cell envelope integrity protein TolA [Legionellales bacterium]
MTLSPSYRFALSVAVMLHILLLFMLLWESSTDHPVLTAAKNPEANLSRQSMSTPTEPEAIKAVSVDNKMVMDTVNRLKEERLQKQRAENNRQKELTALADAAQKKRILEQHRLEELKRESAIAAEAHKKQLAEEKSHLQALAKKKLEEESHLAEMRKQEALLKKQHMAEAHKVAELKKANEEELASREQAKLASENETRARKQKASAQKAALDAEKNAQMAGEVDKYKALIIGAISRQWILPEHADPSLSSQFRIRLAPNGTVLEVSLSKSSGDAVLDRSAQSAIYKASPLPVPSDPDLFNVFRDISLTVRPESARG